LKKKLLALSFTMALIFSMLPLIAPTYSDFPPFPNPDFKVIIEHDITATLPPELGAWDPAYLAAPDPDFDPPPADAAWGDGFVDMWPGVCSDLPPTYTFVDGGASYFEPYTMQAPTCGDLTFTAEVWVQNVQKLYSYYFTIMWDYCWLELVSATPIDLPGPEGMTFNAIEDFDLITPGDQPSYYQGFAFLGEVEGFTGSAPVAELTFKVIQDPVLLTREWTGEGNPYPTSDVFYSLIYIFPDTFTATDDCGQAIPNMGLRHAVARLLPKKPMIILSPEKEIKWIQHDKFTVTVTILNAVKLKSIHLTLGWTGHLIVDVLEPDAVVISDFLPAPYEYKQIDVDNVNKLVTIEVKSDSLYQGSHGSGAIVDVTFTVVHPLPYKIYEIPALWACGEDDLVKRKTVPPYIWVEEKHDYFVQDYPGEIIVDSVDIDVWRCYQDNWQQHQHPDAFGFWDVDAITLDIWYLAPYYFYGTTVTPRLPIYPGADCIFDRQLFGVPITYVPLPAFAGIVDFDFRPITGDLDFDGHVGLLDLGLIQPYFGWSQFFLYSSFVNTGSMPDSPSPAYLAGIAGNTVLQWMASHGFVSWPAWLSIFAGTFAVYQGAYPTSAAAWLVWQNVMDLDLNGDGQIDLLDFVILAKHFCDTEPEILDP
jgi:hypothetical protein